ncbi:MAG TPA: hypothetical protein VF702_10985 [Allosphingosinicella sp.]|jgi:hypothetical protein
MPVALLAAAALAGQVPAAPLPAPRALTREEALTQPVDVLARRLLGATGALVREMERPSPASFFDGPWLMRLTFASAPRWSGIAGLCQADLFHLGFEPAGEAEEGQEPPVRVAHLWMQARYRAIGEPAATGAGWTPDDHRREDRACAQSGPVLGASNSYFGGRTRPNGDDLDAGEAAFAIRVYRAAIASARRGALAEIPCRNDVVGGTPPICDDPRATVAALPLDGPNWLEIDPCGETPETLCVSAIVPRNIDALGPQRRIQVRIATAHPTPGLRLPSIELRGVDLAAHTIMY